MHLRSAAAVAAFLLVAAPSSRADAQAAGWAARLTAGEGDEIRALAGGADGSVVVVGFTPTALPVSGGDVVRHGRPGSPDAPDADGDVFVVKYDAAGRRTWAVLAGGSGRDEPFAVAVATDGAVLVAGESYSTDAPGGGPLGDAFLLRISADGRDASWPVHRAGAGAEDAFLGVTAAPDGRVAVVGFVTPSVGASPNAAVVVLGPDGTVLIDERIAGSHDDRATHAAFTQLGELTVVGRTQSGDLPARPFPSALHGAAGAAPDVFVARWDASLVGASLAYVGSDAFDSPVGIGTVTRAGVPSTRPLWRDDLGAVWFGQFPAVRVRSVPGAEPPLVAAGPGGRIWWTGPESGDPDGFASDGVAPRDVVLHAFDVSAAEDAYWDRSPVRGGAAIGGAGEDVATTLAVAPDGAPLVAGRTGSDALPGEVAGPAPTGRDLFVARLRDGAVEAVTNVRSVAAGSRECDVQWDVPGGLADASVEICTRAAEGPGSYFQRAVVVLGRVPAAAGTFRRTGLPPNTWRPVEVRVVRADERTFGPLVSGFAITAPDAPQWISARGRRNGLVHVRALPPATGGVLRVERRSGGEWTRLPSPSLPDWIGGLGPEVTYRVRAENDYDASAASDWIESVPVRAPRAFDLGLVSGAVGGGSYLLSGVAAGAPRFDPRRHAPTFVIRSASPGGASYATDLVLTLPARAAAWRRTAVGWRFRGRAGGYAVGATIHPVTGAWSFAAQVRGPVYVARAAGTARIVAGAAWGGAAGRDERDWHVSPEDGGAFLR